MEQVRRLVTRPAVTPPTHHQPTVDPMTTPRMIPLEPDPTFGDLWTWHREDSPTCQGGVLQMGPLGYLCPYCGWQALTPGD